MISLEGLKEAGIGIIEDVKTFIGEKPLATAGIGAGVVGVTTAGVVGVKAITSKKKKRKRTKKKVTSKYKRKTKGRKLKFGSPAWRKKYCKKGRKKKGLRYTPHTAGKGKDRSRRRIRQTKHGQPYIILANGRARFIKKSSARRSRKLKGGRY